MQGFGITLGIFHHIDIKNAIFSFNAGIFYVNVRGKCPGQY